MRSSQSDLSDLSDLGWKLLEPLLPKPSTDGRPITHSRRIILNAIYLFSRALGF